MAAGGSVVIAVVVVVIVCIFLSCLRRRRAMAQQQQMMVDQQQAAELGMSPGSNTMYVYQYPPPGGQPTSLTGVNSPYGTSALSSSPYAPPPPAMNSYYAASVATPPQSHTVPGSGGRTYPPMPQTPQAVNGLQYVAAQDGSAGLTASNSMAAAVPIRGGGGGGGAGARVGSTDEDGVPTLPPPPYTPTK